MNVKPLSCYSVPFRQPTLRRATVAPQSISTPNFWGKNGGGGNPQAKLTLAMFLATGLFILTNVINDTTKQYNHDQAEAAFLNFRTIPQNKPLVDAAIGLLKDVEDISQFDEDPTADGVERIIVKGKSGYIELSKEVVSVKGTNYEHVDLTWKIDDKDGELISSAPLK